MNDLKEKRSRLQIMISVLALTVILFLELYLMLHDKENYIWIIGLAVLALGVVYLLVSACLTLIQVSEFKKNEQFENIYKTEKASYLMLKNTFGEIQNKLDELEKSLKVPSEEIINAQKGIAKVIINRNKENADAILNSNDQLLEWLENAEKTQTMRFSNNSNEIKLELIDAAAQTGEKIQDLLVQLKDMELRLNQIIMDSSKVVVQSPVAYASMEEPKAEEVKMEPEVEEVKIEPEVEEVKTEEEKPEMQM